MSDTLTVGLEDGSSIRGRSLAADAFRRFF